MPLISGGVTLVARHGRIAHLEATGVTDIDTKKAMTKDAVFRIASMTKPVTGLAIMMMMEEGKLRITDPVSKYIPSFKDLKVAVAQPRQGPPPGADEPARLNYYSVPAEREGEWVRFAQAEYGVAPGQAAVAYDGTRLLGGGVIAETVAAESRVNAAAA